MGTDHLLQYHNITIRWRLSRSDYACKYKLKGDTCTCVSLFLVSMVHGKIESLN